jgi:hypothetical protein
MAEIEFSVRSGRGGLGRAMKPFLLIAFAGALWAQAPQTPTPAAQTPAAQDDAEQQTTRRREVYVRRLSFGASVGAALPSPTKDETLSQSFSTTPALALQANNSGKSSGLTFGAVLQLALTSHWAVAVAPTYRTRIKMESTVVQFVGTDNVNTVQDDREGTNLSVQTSARFLDVPVYARYYRKSRSERGVRWFVEVGPRMRSALAVRTATHVQPPPNKGDAYDLTKTVSYRKRINGGSAGFGLQFIDDFGIRFVPEVRYTRWFGSNFGDISGRSRTNQVELIFTLGF